MKAQETGGTDAVVSNLVHSLLVILPSRSNIVIIFTL